MSHFPSLVGTRDSRLGPKRSPTVQPVRLTAVSQSRTFASELIRADSPLIAMFTQTLINLSSCSDLCVNTEEVRALCQPTEPAPCPS